jgi:glucose uptake protein GlcU
MGILNEKRCKRMPHDHEHWRQIKTANTILFIATFFYYRVYSYGCHLILNRDANRVLMKMSVGWVEGAHIYLSLYMLYGLNLYWARIILRGAYSKWFAPSRQIN